MGLMDELKKRMIWDKAAEIPGYNNAVWRHDQYGNVIRYSDYGDRTAKYGWEFDHTIPNTLGGLDAYANLRPLHYRANASLGGTLGNVLAGLGGR